MSTRLRQISEKAAGIGAPRSAALAALLLCGVGLTGFGGVAHAVPITFELDPANSTARFTDVSGLCLGSPADCTPVATINPNPTPVRFELDGIGDFVDVSDFLTVSIGRPFLAFGQATLEASIAFLSPSSEVSTLAQGIGSFVSLFVFEYGELTWTSQPANVVFDDGTEVSIAFSGGKDVCWLKGCKNGLSVDVAARTTLRAVPEPGMLVLLGAGLVGFGVWRRARPSRA